MLTFHNCYKQFSSSYVQQKDSSLLNLLPSILRSCTIVLPLYQLFRQLLLSYTTKL